jgi:hypothetical protein
VAWRCQTTHGQYVSFYEANCNFSKPSRFKAPPLYKNFELPGGADLQEQKNTHFAAEARKFVPGWKNNIPS